MKKCIPLLGLMIVLTGLMSRLYAQADSVMAKNISNEIMLHGAAYDNLRVLCKTIGHRLSGSPQQDKAIAWGKALLEQSGADKVWLQPVMVPKWTRGKESLRIKNEGKWISIPMLSLGNSEGTNGKTLSAEIIYFDNMDALKAAPEAAVKGKIVFLNYAFRQDFLKTFDAYSDIAAYRFNGANVAAKKGAVGLIIRSLSTGLKDVPHTGSMRYEDEVQKIPALAIGNSTAAALGDWCKKGKPVAELRSECGMKEMVMAYNVIGELQGTQEGYLVVGGHLDSWDVGEGAQDDGAGCVQSIEVLRTLKKLNIKPKHTIRVVLFANEENGMKGGLAYADSAKAKNERHILALESDEGGYTPRGFSLKMTDADRATIKTWKNIFFPMGVYDFEEEGGGVDIGPLAKQGCRLAGLMPDSQRYFDMHHSQNDVFEDVNKRELHLGAVAMTTFIYMADQYFD
ncbi:peptidase M28 [Taibaiella sp. KBW10]|uniref:M20/M25/M40 family metallo-hydrolase n=1 Tax=Taibaiella sp. KBW10 TaxID=2153357 RepID=UPI000F5A3497|nr:M20/M25/M40 family metallo-hydrolase [Taibaiella sp. KBW10]RQO30582.1 peptidase M28 [Taibaiella sp. KBW10]